MKVSDIKAPVSSISGVGPQLTKILAKINVFTVGDLLEYYPRDYEDRSQRVCLRDFDKHKKVHTVAQVTGQEWFGYGSMKTLKLRIPDGSANAADILSGKTAYINNNKITGTMANNGKVVKSLT